jgi:hypothetical protein
MSRSQTPALIRVTVGLGIAVAVLTSTVRSNAWQNVAASAQALSRPAAVTSAGGQPGEDPHLAAVTDRTTSVSRAQARSVPPAAKKSAAKKPAAKKPAVTTAAAAPLASTDRPADPQWWQVWLWM